MKLVIALILILFVGGCDARSRGSVDSESKSRSVVRNTISESMGIPENILRDDLPLPQLPTPMDDLDIVELVMELEDVSGVTIPDKLIVDAAGTDGTDVLPQHLTINKLVVVLEPAKSTPATHAPPADEVTEPVVTLTPTAASKVRDAQQQNGNQYCELL